MNKKGLAELGVIIGAVVGINLLAPMAINYLESPEFCSAFKARKAIEKCVASNESADCPVYVKELSKREILDYIRDK